MPRGKGVYVDEDDPGDDSRRRVAHAADADDFDAQTPDVDKPEPGSEPPD